MAVPRRLAIVILVVVAIAGCTAPSRTTFPPLGSTPGPAGDLTNPARLEIVSALAAAGLQAVDSNRPFRRPEGPLLAGAPRSVLEVPLPDDPDPASIVLYAFHSSEEATLAAADHADYLSSGPGAIQFAPGTRFVLQVVDTTVV
ncbi:MAG: hypothetical protein L0227_08060, partial [Chloroflexi bacterium]|nr:hypothetical protein [Chloroflexota bacterium]